VNDTFLSECIAELDGKWWRRFYTHYRHFGATMGISLGAAFYGLYRSGPFVIGSDLPHVVRVLTVIVAFELLAHRLIMHRRIDLPVLRTIYKEHAGMHHTLYTKGHMAVRSGVEWRFILIPASAIAGATAAAGLFSSLYGLVYGAHGGWLMLMTAGFYLAHYEPFHLLLHQSWCPAWIRHHHEEHHDPSLMRAYNMGVTPIAALVEIVLRGFRKACVRLFRGRPSLS